jgi:hypothetical protein
MKSFRTYLAESVHTYNYKVRIAGDAPKNFIDLFKHNLQKFDPVSISEPKSTPIQKKPLGFPELENHSVTIIDVKFKYPATEPMIKQIATLLGYDENLIRVVGSEHQDGLDNEIATYAKQSSPVLGNDELEDNGKEASKEYGDSYLNRIKRTNPQKVETGYSGKVERAAHDPFAPKVEASKSPLSTVKLPPLPKTGSK